MKNVACIGYIYIYVCVCSRMQLTVQVVLLCALMKNYLRIQYICSRMQLTGTSFSMCIDEKLVGFSGKKYGHNVNKSSAVYFCTNIPFRQEIQTTSPTFGGI